MSSNDTLPEGEMSGKLMPGTASKFYAYSLEVLLVPENKSDMVLKAEMGLEENRRATGNDLEQLNSKLVKAQLSVLAEESKDGEPVAYELGDREIHGSGENTSVNSLPLFHRDGWELIDFSPDSDLSRDASSDEAPVDNTSTENLEPAEYWIDLDALGGFDLTNETSSDQALSGTSFNLANFCRPAVPGPSFDNKLGGKVLARL
ncbi:hypothetical protein B0J14DRAFT_659161 [Halenospora varia]|nr:hypothetical protein B0J14DRAFT_659161 [Halenospora varia]